MRNGGTAELSGITKVTKGYFNSPARGTSLIRRGLRIPGAREKKLASGEICEEKPDGFNRSASILEIRRFRVLEENNERHEWRKSPRSPQDQVKGQIGLLEGSPEWQKSPFQKYGAPTSSGRPPSS